MTQLIPYKVYKLFSKNVFKHRFQTGPESSPNKVYSENTLIRYCHSATINSQIPTQAFDKDCDDRYFGHCKINSDMFL
ncbi:hypothetical protein C8N25_10831 [Algoriphagus antarcticus]|uniref:Uncharacterized protein n=1 Tax=Algoriphagus antarcticus TaxID=238540 RepID=A0A3E0DVG8_9BACT|nr:hypothetical protein C8N25_10831 [Algoriphagus antarcticus]